MQAILLLVLFAFKLTTYGSYAWGHHSNNNNVVQASWEDEASDEKLLHLTIDEQSGQKRVYIGAVNKIYQLSSDLKLEAQAVMGPAPDNYECPVSRHCPNVEKKPMNYYNKALVIYTPNNMKISQQQQRTSHSQSAATAFPNSQLNKDSTQPTSSSTSPLTSHLISCGTLFQGSCALHNLDNITDYYIPANESVVANSQYASTVAFIAPGPPKLFLSRQPDVLYVGASYTGLGPYNTEVPAVSSRSLQPDSMFNFAASNVATGTRLTVNSLSRDRFPINYVYGFSYRGFSYFVTVQRKSYNSHKPFITKLVRVCQKDVDYHSYVEVPLVCRTDSGTDYNLAQAAYVGHPGTNLANSLGIAITDEVLYVVFAKSKDKRDIYNEPSSQSALCVYALPVVHRIFAQNIQHCFNGNGQQGLDFISQTVPCIQTQVQITDDFCGMDVNNLISGMMPIETSPVIEYKDVSLTAVAASPKNEFTVAFLGTSNGQLRRLVIDDIQTANEYSVTVVDPNRKTPINSDMRFDRRDKSAEFIYVMNDKKVYLIKVQECNLYKMCADCLDANLCPNPQILSFEPMTGPYEGGTNLTIKGVNLGTSFEDIRTGVKIEISDSSGKVASIECIPYRELYVETSQITCQTVPPIVIDTSQNSIPSVSMSGVISVQIGQEYIARSPERFNYVNPKIMQMMPSKGPKSGGTKLILWGFDTDAGSRAEAYVGNAPCIIIERKNDKVECITTQAERPGQQRFSMRFDNAERIFHEYNFLYVEDPEVDFVTSNKTSMIDRNGAGAAESPPKGIPAGGIAVHVKGKNFTCIQEPKFYVVVDGVKYNSSCQVENAAEMSCLSPIVPEEKILPYRQGPNEPVALDYGFFMDNVEGVHNLGSRRHNPLPMFLMYSNPEYEPFPEEVKFYNSDYLTINGSNLDRASSEYDVMVRIGSGFCNVTSLSRTQLTCKPPPIQPEALNWRGQLDGNQLPDVVVTVGNSLNFTIGKISYDSYGGLRKALSRSILFFLVVGACFLIFIVIVILMAYRRKASECSRVVKTMQEQMDVLEMKVASEAKQAFTELQTEMTDLTDDLEHGGIPYLDYRIYTMKVLFPNSSDHPVLNEMQVDPKIRPNLEKGLMSFGQLILNKTFLLLFIRTLESNRYFSMRDRVNVASLIMVTLQNRMEYCTDILKTLLADLIEKSMESRSHPKLLLRRTESVAEKMLSSWFTFLLYKFLRECAGEPLFLLYQAIKHQVNKGPVDAITSEARCSLSEEKLIRQSVDYKPMVVNVSISPQTAYFSRVDANGLQSDQNLEIQVKVLDCDTISQVKDKAIDAIYKSMPSSQRPNKDNLDLEWRASQTARVVMADEDHTTKIEGYWKRLNTLAHYRVPDRASLTLMTKQTPIYEVSMMGDKHRYETLSHFEFSKTLSPLCRPTSPLDELENSGFKYWHLVRHHDNDYRDGERSGKMVSEIYLTRLLATKGTLQRFVDDLFETIFSTARLTSSLPIAIKYMFDFLDDQARSHGKFIARQSTGALLPIILQST